MDRPALARSPGTPTVTATRIETTPAPSPPPVSTAARTRSLALRAAAIGMLAFDAVALSWGRVLGPDTYISLTAGRQIAAHGLPHVDRLSVAAAGRPWIDQQWLAHVIFYGLWRLGGDPAVAASSGIAVGAAVGLLFALCLRRGADLVATWLGVGGALVICLMYAETRAQSFAYPLFVALIWIILSELDRGRFSPRALLVVPVLVLWANLHGSVLLGAAVAAGCFGTRALLAVPPAPLPLGGGRPGRRRPGARRGARDAIRERDRLVLPARAQRPRPGRDRRVAAVVVHHPQPARSSRSCSGRSASPASPAAAACGCPSGRSGSRLPWPRSRPTPCATRCGSPWPQRPRSR